MRGKSKRRVEMGEEAWAEFQRQRIIQKTYRYKKRNVQAVVNWRRLTKLKLIEYKGGKCEICGYNKPVPSCYDFHHLDPNKKDFGISGKSVKFETIKLEVDKCQLLCKLCHAEIHDREYSESRKLTIDKIKSG